MSIGMNKITIKFFEKAKDEYFTLSLMHVKNTLVNVLKVTDRAWSSLRERT